MPRSAVSKRITKETSIEASLDLDGSGISDISTSIPFFDHMLTTFTKHSGIDLFVSATGDIQVDTHHLIEDTGIVIGGLLKECLGDKVGIARFASVSIPLDEALIDVALDLSGRAYIFYQVELQNQIVLGNPGYDPQLSEEFFRALCLNAEICLHIEMRRGKNPHHVHEATFKGVARALGAAKSIVGSDIPSTKGSL